MSGELRVTVMLPVVADKLASFTDNAKVSALYNVTGTTAVPLLNAVLTVALEG